MSIFLRVSFYGLVFFSAVGVSDIGLLKGSAGFSVYEAEGRVHFRRCVADSPSLERICQSSYTGTYSISKEDFIKNLQADYSIPAKFTGSQGALLLSKRIEDSKATLEEANPLRDLDALRKSLENLFVYQGRILKVQEGIYPYLSKGKNMVINHRDEQPLYQRILDSFYTKAYDEESNTIFWIIPNIEVFAREGGFSRCEGGAGSRISVSYVFVGRGEVSELWKRLLRMPSFGKELRKLNSIPLWEGENYDYTLINGLGTSKEYFKFGTKIVNDGVTLRALPVFLFQPVWYEGPSSRHFDFVCTKAGDLK